MHPYFFNRWWFIIVSSHKKVWNHLKTGLDVWIFIIISNIGIIHKRNLNGQMFVLLPDFPEIWPMKSFWILDTKLLKNTWNKSYWNWNKHQFLWLGISKTTPSIIYLHKTKCWIKKVTLFNLNLKSYSLPQWCSQYRNAKSLSHTQLSHLLSSVPCMETSFKL